MPLAIAITGQGDPRAELVAETGLRQDRENRYVTSSCPRPGP